MSLSPKEGRKPIIAQVVRDTGVLVNVERALIDSSEGEALIDIPDESCRIVKDRLTDLGASVRILEEEIILDETECVDCGACEAVCPVGAAKVQRRPDDRHRRSARDAVALAQPQPRDAPFGSAHPAGGGKPPVATGPQRRGVTRMTHLP